MDKDNIKCQLYIDLEEERQEEESGAAELSIAGPSLKSGERRSNMRSNSMKTTVTGEDDSSDSSCYIPIKKKKLNQQKLVVVQESSNVRISPRLATLKKRKELAKASQVSKPTVQSTRKR